MSAKIKTLFDKLGNKLYPKTKTSAVYDENNTSLDTILSNIYNKDESDETFLLRSEQKKLGARNVWTDDYTKYGSRQGSATIIKNTNGFSIQCTSTNPSGFYITSTRIKGLFEKYGKITLSFEFMGDMSCSCNVGMTNKSPITTLPTDWTTYSATFNAKAQASNLCFYNTDSTKTPVISVRNIMVRLASDTDDTYTEYTKTNIQLTKAINYLFENTNVAPTEDGSTSSDSYSVGEFIIRKGILYKVISAISSGDELIEGTNIHDDTIGSEISTLNSDLTNKLSWTLLTSVNANGTYTNLPDMSDMTELMFRLYLTQARTTVLIMNKVDFINNKAFPDFIAGSNVRIYALFEWVSTTSIKVSSLTGLTTFHQDAVIQVLGR